MAQIVSDTKARLTATVSVEKLAEISKICESQKMKQNQFLCEAIDAYIDFLNKNFNIPDLLVQRLNQVIDGMNALSSNVKNLEDITASGFESFIALARGDNYLLDSDDGEL